MSDFKKILIKAPSERAVAATTFPLIHQIKSEFPNSQIHIIVGEGQELVYKVFPFETLTYVYDEKDKSLPSIHKYAVNLHDIFNIDLFFDLEGGFKSSFLGFSFKAKDRIGYIKGMNKFLLTHREEEFNSYRPDKIPLKLLESFLEKSFSDTKICGIETTEQLKTKDIEELVKLPPYFFIHSSNLLETPEFWNDFFRFFEEQYFVIWFDPTLGEEELEKTKEYFKALEQKNVYLVKTGPEELFLKLLVHSIGYFSDNLDWSHIASYLGVKTYTQVGKATDLPFMEHFKSTPILIEMEDGVPLKWIGPEETKPVETVDRLVNLLHDIHEL